LFIYNSFSIKLFYSCSKMNKYFTTPALLLFRRRKANALLTLFWLMLLAGCQDNMPVSETGKISPELVDLTIATKVAESYIVIENSNQTGANGKKAAPATKKVKDKTTVSEKETPAFYVFNYEGGGFLVLSATKKYYPVLAKSATGYFSVSNPGDNLGEWITHTKEKLYKLVMSDDNLSDKDLIGVRWQKLGVDADTGTSKGGRVAICDDPNYTYPVWIGPLTATAWGQECNYNDNTPNLGAGCGCNNHAPTGCVATAMAQVMKYWGHPSGFNWGGMPNNGGATATAQLMANIGTAVGMNYQCGVSTANYTNATNAFRNTYQYPNVQYLAPGSYSRNAVTNNLNNSRPVLLAGFRDGVQIGHAWVCDGYFIERLCGRYDDYYLSMNWGFDGQGNGYYHDSNWDGYNLGNQAIVNIYP
jgi:Peptidase C10 family/Spi protease inhibitor